MYKLFKNKSTKILLENSSLKTTCYYTVAVIHLIIGYDYLGTMEGSSELASTLLRLGSKIKFITLALFYSFVILITFLIIDRTLEAPKFIKFTILVILCIISINIYSKAALNERYPKTSYTEDEILKLKIETANDTKARVFAILKKHQLFLPSKSIQQKDVKEIEKIICNQWENFRSLRKIGQPENIPILSKFNALLSMNYSAVETDSIIELRKRTTKVSNMIYSPGFQKFIAIVTYEYSKKKSNKYSYITILGQKVKGKIYCYAFTGNLTSGSSTLPDRVSTTAAGLLDVFYYKGIQFKGYDNEYGFGGKLLKLKNIENPPSVHFWVSDGVKNLFKLKKDTSIIEYYYTDSYHKDSVENYRQIWVYEN